MITKMNPIERLQKICLFDDPYDCYVILGISRKKDTPTITNSQEIVFREVIKREEDIIRKYNALKAMISNYKDENGKAYPFYLYISCNPRNALSATFILKRQINHWLHETVKGVDNSRMFKKLHGHFYSALMKPDARGKNRHFMLDIDTKDQDKLTEINDCLRHVLVPLIILKAETRNGYHVRTEPFDRNMFNKLIEVKGLKDVCEVKTDANFFIEYIQND